MSQRLIHARAIRDALRDLPPNERQELAGDLLGVSRYELDTLKLKIGSMARFIADQERERRALYSGEMDM